MKANLLYTTAEQNKGVIGRDALDPDEVYIFVNLGRGTGFHMQGVKFPIDIAFLDQDCGIIKIATLEPEKDRIVAPEDTVHAVEACKDYFKDHNLQEGDFWKEVYNKVSENKV